MSTEPNTPDTGDPRLLRVAVDICENCRNGVPGTCHVPGCLFCRYAIEDTPQPLRYRSQVLNEVNPAPSVASDQASIRGQITTAICQVIHHHHPCSAANADCRESSQATSAVLNVLEKRFRANPTTPDWEDFRTAVLVCLEIDPRTVNR